MAAARRLDGINVADHVGDGHIRRGELLHITLIGYEPGDWRFLAMLRNQVAAAAADGTVRIVVNLAAGDIRHIGIEQRRQHANQTRFGLAAQSQENEVVPRENRVDDLRHYGIVITDDAWK